MLYLHIGTEKTGSTAIQNGLWACREQLYAQGFYVPEALGINHRELTLYAAVPDYSYDLRAFYQLDFEAYQQFLACFPQRLVQLLQPKLAAGFSILLTNEHLGSRLRTHADVEKLYQLLSLLQTPIRVIVYLRPQEKIIPSLYSTAVKGGDEMRDLESYCQDVFLNLYYDELLQPWATVFGKANIQVVPCQPQQLVGRSAVTHFMQLIGCAEKVELPPECELANTALDATTLEFLRRFNQYCPSIIDGGINPVRVGIVPMLRKRASGIKLSLSNIQVTKIRRQYALANRTVAKEYLCRSDGCLFIAEQVTADTDFIPNQLDVNTTVAMAADVWQVIKRACLHQENINHQIRHSIRQLTATIMQLERQYSGAPIRRSVLCFWGPWLWCKARAVWSMMAKVFHHHTP